MSAAESWIQTHTGRKVFPLWLKASDVCIEDIAHHLSHLCRFTGATKEFYSVAQHSVYVSLQCVDGLKNADDGERNLLALCGLLHDASEAYLIDLPRPLKRHADFAFYRTAEADAMLAIASAFDLPARFQELACIKQADGRVLATEARDLMAPLHPEWRSLLEPYPRRIYGWSPELAKSVFVSRFEELTRARAA